MYSTSVSHTRLPLGCLVSLQQGVPLTPALAWPGVTPAEGLCQNRAKGSAQNGSGLLLPTVSKAGCVAGYVCNSHNTLVRLLLRCHSLEVLLSPHFLFILKLLACIHRRLLLFCSPHCSWSALSPWLPRESWPILTLPAHF